METVASMPNWIIFAAVGAILGAIGATLSWMLGGTDHKWTRLLPIVAIACTVPVTREWVIPSIQSAIFENRLQEQRWIVTLRAEMPDEYEKVISEFKAISTSAAAADAKKRSFEVMANFRKRYATAFGSAADQNLTQYLQGYLDMLKAVRDESGPGPCADFATKGASVLGKNPSAYTALVEKNIVLTIQTIASARRNPHPVDPATESDWGVAMAKFIDAGGTQEELQLVESQSASSPSYCQAIIRFLQAIVDTPAPSGHRIRAMMAMTMAES